MSPLIVFCLGAYIGACAGAMAVLYWWYCVDSKRDGGERWGK